MGYNQISLNYILVIRYFFQNLFLHSINKLHDVLLFILLILNLSGYLYLGDSVPMYYHYLQEFSY